MISMFLEILNIVFNSFTPARNLNRQSTLNFLDNMEDNNILSFEDCYNLSITSKSLLMYSLEKKFLCFNITALDLSIYKMIITYGSRFLYYEFRCINAKRFIELFGYVYGEIKVIPLDDRYNHLFYKFTEKHIDSYYKGYFMGWVLDNAENFTATPLHVAASAGKVDICKLYIESGEDIYKIDDVGMTVFEVCCIDNFNLCKYLLENYTINIHNKAIYGYTPLHIATIYSNTRVVGMLLKHGANANLKDAHGNTPILYSLGKPNVVRMLIEKTNLDILYIGGLNLLQHLEQHYVTSDKVISKTKRIILKKINSMLTDF